jgi:hypothetical protein
METSTARHFTAARDTSIDGRGLYSDKPVLSVDAEEFRAW